MMEPAPIVRLKARLGPDSDRMKEVVVGLGLDSAFLPASMAGRPGIQMPVTTRIPGHEDPVTEFSAGIALIDVEGRRAPIMVYASAKIHTPLLSDSFLGMLGFKVDLEKRAIAPVRPYPRLLRRAL
jgi:hypothetical protein